MSKFKNWLKQKLRSWLEIDICENTLELLNKTTNKNFDKVLYSIKAVDHKLEVYSKNIDSEISHFQESVNTLHTTIENIVHIGTDVRFNEREHSWAVVCIEGKINIVKFIELDKNNAKDMLHILKQFEGGRHCIDTPYSNMFYDGIFKF